MELKFVNMSPLHFIPAAGGFLNFQVEPLLTAHEEYRDHSCIIRIILLIIWSLNMVPYVVLDLPYPNVRVYMETAVVVVTSYMSLLVINVSFIVLAVFPFFALIFIGALCNTLRGDNGGGEAAGASSSTSVASDEGEKTPARRKQGEKAIGEAEQLKAISVVPYWVLCAMGHFRAENFAVSQFLLFLSTTLGALTLMMMRLPAGAGAPGVAPASELLRKASLVVLLVTVHTMAAELLGEDVVLFCMPELVPALLWFSIHLDRGSSVITVDRIKSHRNGLFVLGAAAVAGFAYLVAAIDEYGLSMCARTSLSCGVSGLLVYYVVFMLRQWPAQGTAPTVTTVSYLEEAVQLLKFWANVLLVAASALLVSTLLAAVRLDLHGEAVPALRRFLKEYYV